LLLEDLPCPQTEVAAMSELGTLLPALPCHGQINFKDIGGIQSMHFYLISVEYQHFCT